MDYCKEQKIVLTRSRPYKKNDQAWIEQKDGSVVRRLVGYGRLEGAAAAEALGALHDVARLYVNFFQPSFKLKSKVRVEAQRNLIRRELPAASGPDTDTIRAGPTADTSAAREGMAHRD